MNIYLPLIIVWGLVGAAEYFAAPWWVIGIAIVLAVLVSLVVGMFVMLGRM